MLSSWRNVYDDLGMSRMDARLTRFLPQDQTYQWVHLGRGAADAFQEMLPATLEDFGVPRSSPYAFPTIRDPIKNLP